MRGLFSDGLGSNFKHSSVRLEETIYIKYFCYKKSIQWTEKDGLQEIQNKAIEIAFFAVLTVLSDSILGDVLIYSQSSRESLPGLCKNYAARKRVFSVSPLLYYQYLWVGESGKS